MKIRNPAVAGSFYPGSGEILSAQIGDLFNASKKISEFESAGRQNQVLKALIVPHAGYQYSGLAAAFAYRCLESCKDRIHRVVLLGPAHRVYLTGIATTSATHFQTPLGLVEIDQAYSETVTENSHITVNDEAHHSEHSLEVQLPFLQYVLSDFQLLPLVVGNSTTEMVADVLKNVWGADDTLVIVSTDLSHFHRDSEAKQIDEHTAKLIMDLNQNITGEQACGHFPLNGLLNVAEGHHMSIHQLFLNNSSDFSGDVSRVVGYGAFSLYETAGTQL